MDHDSLRAQVTAALDKIRSRLLMNTPRIADRVFEWISSLWSGPQLEDYWTHPEAFPMLLAPWWLEEKLCSDPNPPLQPDLIYSSINVYCYIRLIDNVMDGDVSTDLNLLPILGFFHAEFQRTYHDLFSRDDRFWEYFTELWSHSAEVTILDGSTQEFDLTRFFEIAAQKTCAAKIPVAAVAYKYDRIEVLPAWSYFLDRFSCWSQMLNDAFDWLNDSLHHSGTFFLSEASRRKAPSESLIEWVLREGLIWGMDTLDTWMTELKVLARDLESQNLLDYLDNRAGILAERRSLLTQGLQSLAKLRSALDTSL
jgi:hypothetical protein